jgi:hypothetical protein
MRLTVENKSFITNRLVDETESKRTMEQEYWKSSTVNVSGDTIKEKTAKRLEYE